MTITPIEIAAAAFGIVGTLLLALNGKRAGWGFVAFIVSNAGWIWFGVQTGHAGLVVQNLVFTATSLTGVYVWLIKRRLDAAGERAAIAKIFNDRYTYRTQWIAGMPILPGTFYGGPHRSGYAWMCPECNHVHHPVSDSLWTGLQYPACCSSNAGDRLSHGIRIN
jgi:hypothetical protein